MELQFKNGLPFYKRPIVEIDVEDNSGVSVSVPDLSYSVSELVKNFAVGVIPSDIARKVMYTDNPDFDDFIETELPNYDLSDMSREIQKLRQLYNLRMDRRKAAVTEDSPQVQQGTQQTPQEPQVKQQKE